MLIYLRAEKRERGEREKERKTERERDIERQRQIQRYKGREIGRESDYLCVYVYVGVHVCQKKVVVMITN